MNLLAPQQRRNSFHKWYKSWLVTLLCSCLVAIAFLLHTSLSRRSHSTLLEAQSYHASLSSASSASQIENEFFALFGFPVWSGGILQQERAARVRNGTGSILFIHNHKASGTLIYSQAVVSNLCPSKKMLVRWSYTVNNGPPIPLEFSQCKLKLQQSSRREATFHIPEARQRTLSPLRTLYNIRFINSEAPLMIFSGKQCGLFNGKDLVSLTPDATLSTEVEASIYFQNRVALVTCIRHPVFRLISGWYFGCSRKPLTDFCANRTAERLSLRLQEYLHSCEPHVDGVYQLNNVITNSSYFKKLWKRCPKNDSQQLQQLLHDALLEAVRSLAVEYTVVLTTEHLDQVWPLMRYKFGDMFENALLYSNQVKTNTGSYQLEGVSSRLLRKVEECLWPDVLLSRAATLLSQYHLNQIQRNPGSSRSNPSVLRLSVNRKIEHSWLEMRRKFAKTRII